jgi:predicted enzyme related to lactoylglutathione lyase
MPDARHNRFDYIELSAPTPEALATTHRFFNAAFGWEYQTWGPAYSDTQTSGAGKGVTSGIAVGTAVPLPVIYCADLVAAKERVLAAGGKIVKDIFEFPGGKRFQFKDPAGNELAVWSDVV